MHLGVALYHTLKERKIPILFLSRYLRQPLTRVVEAWAKWHLIDHLALAGRCEEVITTQQELRCWALQHFPLRDVLWVMNDATQALCWTRKEQGTQWMQIFSDLLSQAEATEKTVVTDFIICGRQGLSAERYREQTKRSLLPRKSTSLCKKILVGNIISKRSLKHSICKSVRIINSTT